MNPGRDVELLFHLLWIILLAHFTVFVIYQFYKFLRAHLWKYDWYRNLHNEYTAAKAKIKYPFIIEWILNKISAFLKNQLESITPHDYEMDEIMTVLTTTVVLLMAAFGYINDLTEWQIAWILILYLIILCLYAWGDPYRYQMTNEELFYHERLLPFWACITIQLVIALIHFTPYL